MARVDSRIDNGDDLTLPLLGHLVGVHYDLSTEVVGVLVGQAGGLESAFSINRHVVGDLHFAVKERSLDAAHGPDCV